MTSCVGNTHSESAELQAFDRPRIFVNSIDVEFRRNLKNPDPSKVY